jgi:putative DNA primase/helicase
VTDYPFPRDDLKDKIKVMTFRPQQREMPTLESARASTFEMSAIQWLWPNRFALGKLGLLAGMPDEGKGQILCDMAARVTRGDDWPCEEGSAPQGNVILLTAEDDPGDTVVPRLVAAGADLDCVEIVKMVRHAGEGRMFNLVGDLNLLRQKITEVGNVKMIQIDPISAYLGVKQVDSFRTNDVRAVLAPLVALAAELSVAIIGVMHFNKKSDVTNALLRISDSLAFAATARHVYAVVDDAENKRKLFVKGKNNLAAHNIKALAYSFGLREVGNDKKTGKAIEAPHIVWLGHVDVSATEAMQHAAGSKAPRERNDAKRFLQGLLAEGPVPSTEIAEAAEAHGITQRTLRRAREDLNLDVKKRTDGKWTWQLPPTNRVSEDG